MYKHECQALQYMLEDNESYIKESSQFLHFVSILKYVMTCTTVFKHAKIRQLLLQRIEENTHKFISTDYVNPGDVFAEYEELVMIVMQRFK